MNRTFRAIDLFCGCGGLSTGLSQAGWSIVAGVDESADELRTFHGAHPGAATLLLDLIRDEHAVGTVVSLARALGANALVGGPPCQDFSESGKGDGKDGRRNGFPAFLAVAEKLSPEWLLFENVPGLKQRHPQYFAWILETLSRLGYQCQVQTLNSADFGVPQTRKRVFVVGRRGTTPDLELVPTHDKFCREGRPSWIGWGSVMDWSLPIEQPATQIVRKHVRKWMEKHNSDQLQLMVQQLGSGKAEACRVRSKDEPGATVLSSSDGRVDAVLVQQIYGGGNNGDIPRVRGKKNPAPTIVESKGGHFVLCRLDGGDAHPNDAPIFTSQQPAPTVSINPGAVLVQQRDFAGVGDSGMVRQSESPAHTVRSSRSLSALVRLDGEHHKFDGPSAYPEESPSPVVSGSSSSGPRLVLVSGKQHSESFAPPVGIPSTPATTISTEHDNKLLVSIDDLRQRHLTPRELAALQGFPPDFPFFGNLTSMRRQIGNAVPPPVARIIGSAIIAAAKPLLREATT